MSGGVTSERGERIWKGVVLLLFLGVIAAGFWAANTYLPGQHLPWKALDTSRPIGTATKTQLMRLSLSDPQVCTDLVRGTDGFDTIPADPKRPTTGAGAGVCGWDEARIVYGTDATVFAPGESNMQCPLSVAVFLWQREVDTLARRHFDQGLAKIHHMGTYSCRRQRGNGSGRWSEHAFANAWDVAGFELEDGTLIRVLTGWDGERDEANFLREVRSAACGLFRVTLSPDYNAAHADHFHLDMGPSSACR